MNHQARCHRPVLLEINCIVAIYTHVLGHGKYNIGIEIEDKKAKDPHGECVIGTGRANVLSSVHDLKLELLKLKTKYITMTLDCCRTVERNAVIYLQLVIWILKHSQIIHYMI